MQVKTTTGFNECVGVTRGLMKTIGVWPLDDARKLKTRCKFLLPGILLLFFIIIPQTRKAIQARNDLNLMLEVLTTADIIEGIALLKLLGMWYNRIGLKKLIREIDRDWNNTNAEEQQVMWSNARLSKWATIFCYSSSTGSVVTHSFVFLVTSASTYQNSSIERSLYLKSYFPFDTGYTPVYEMICVCQCLGAFLSCAAFSSFDGFFVFSILHFSGQLNNLKHRFRNLVTKHNTGTAGFTKALTFAILRHRHLCDWSLTREDIAFLDFSYTDIIENSFNQTFLVQVTATSIALCLQGYQFVMIISGSGTKLLANLIFIVVFTIGNTVSLFMYCYIAQIIRDESKDLFYAIYEMRWYNVSAKDAVLLVIIMSRCKRPIEITAGKFAAFSLEYFAKVVKTSVGYLSVLLAIRNKLTD